MRLIRVLNFRKSERQDSAGLLIGGRGVGKLAELGGTKRKQKTPGSLACLDLLYEVPLDL